MTKKTEAEKQLKEEQKWLESVQNKLKKYICGPYWDDVCLSNVEYDIIKHIMNTQSVKTLSPSINERITDMIFDNIKKQINKLSQKCK